MASIPCISTEIEESDQQIGEYPLQDTLGYGQYAAVYASMLPDRPDEPLAIKAINKDKLVDLVALHRMSSEIAALRDPGLYHHSILALKEVIHTRRFIYLITERGGKDLFEYFGARESGLPEAILKPLVHRVALAIETLHRHQYCHRDLKPENILYAPDHPVEDHVVKLVDFGLCTKGDTLLSEFCGSPGFFAPEILLQEQYDGRQADIWSLGCILLELLVGNDRFATMWMSMYELDTLKDRTRFAELVEKVQRVSHASHEHRTHYQPWIL
ncbi:hypothetical protein Poli38472_001687 [Pythium oligandrum]|uniref:Protein kinase domain-containing protein n=1 Tax=Pythium oligandrum TaxID=41045 RepID=A0A8K1CTF1_PYTOL|nr:hypothetical protein Poli38472_001687 [Pythium oligandrum]|eukprot:TMW69531.1 hypothetical protein Poli38472_001687 [Pythium oligandrum]